MADLLTLAKVAAVFVAVVLAMKKKVLPLGVSLAGGGLAVALLMGKSVRWIAQEWAGSADSILFSPHTGRFVAVMGMIVGLSYVLERAGQIERLTGAFRACFRSPRVTLATLPAIIGLLPMPGGALFSCPMVEASAAGTALDAEDKALVNYWYRHVWEYCWPLYPGLLVSAQLMHVEVKRISLAQLPLCLAAILGGYVFLVRATPPAGARPKGGRARPALEACVVLLPFFLIFGLYLGARLDLVLSVAVGLAFACLWHLASGNIGAGKLLKSLFVNAGVLDMTILGYGAQTFGEFMLRSEAIGGVAHLFQAMRLPLLLLAVVLPLVVGFFGGMTIVYVMTTFPLLLAYPDVGRNPIPVLTLAFAAGFCGTLLSPVHSCLVMSTRYFNSDLLRPIKRMLAPCGLVLATGLGLLFLYRHLYR